MEQYSMVEKQVELGNISVKENIRQTHIFKTK